MNWVTTSLILDQLGRDDADTWEIFLERFRQPIVNFALNLGLPLEESEDAAQETLTAFLTAYRQGKYDRAKGRLGSWLFGFAHRTVMNRRRNLAVTQRRQSVGQRTTFWDTVPAEETVRKSWNESWQHTMLNLCMKQIRIELEPNTINAFEKFALEGQPAARVATELGMSRNAVFLAKHRVLTRLRELQDQLDDVQ